MKTIKLLLSIVIYSLVIGPLSFAHAAPAISVDEVISVADDSVVISWQTTNEAATTGIKYGLALPVANSYVTDEAAPTKYHYLVLGGLSADTVYYYRLISRSATGTTESIIKSFRTLARPSGNYLFSFAVLSDLHYAPNLANTTSIRGRPYASGPAIVDALVTAVNQFSPAFTIIKGDMLDAGVDNPATRVPELKGRLDNLTAAAGMAKYYPIPGNHDKYINYGLGNNWITNNLGVFYPAGAGLPLADASFNYNFTYQGYRFVMLDSSSVLGTTAEANITTLEAVLAAAQTAKQKAFIFMHHEASEEADIPTSILQAVLDEPSWENSDWDKVRLANKAGFFNAVNTARLGNGEPVTAAVSMGHIHDNRYREFGGIPFVRTSSSLQFPTGFAIFKVYSNGFVQSFYKLPNYSDQVARPLVTGTAEVTQDRAQQFYLGGSSNRNYVSGYSSSGTIVAPTVTAVQPANGAAGVALNQPIILNFTKPMANDTAVDSWLTLTPGTLASADWSWNTDKTTLTIRKTLTASTAYTLKVLAAAAATDSTAFGADYTVAFTAGTTATAIPPVATVDRVRNESGLVTDVTNDTTPTLTGLATDESGSTVTNVEFRYYNGGWSTWEPTTPLDGAFNSVTERFVFTVSSEVTRGEHAVQLRTTNAAGVTTTADFPSYSFWVIAGLPELTIRADHTEIVNGDPIDPSPSFEVLVVTDQTLNSLWFTLDGTRTSILPAAPTYVNRVTYQATLPQGTHDVRIEASDVDSLGNLRYATKEAVKLIVQTSGDVRVYGTPLNYPNPFNAGTESTRISYILSRASNLTLQLYDLAGNLVYKRELPADSDGAAAGYNEVVWDGKSGAGDVVGNGIYIYILVADGKVAAKGKLSVLKR
jgi:hypothetical protein